MNITEILTQAQMSSDAVTDLLIELAQQNKEVTATAQHMCDLYFADVRLREKGIRDKVAALEKQMTELDTQIRGMQAAVVDAAGTGDADTFAQEQDKLAKIEARKAAISTQIKMLRAAHVRGSEELYQAACDAYSDLAKANSAYTMMFQLNAKLGGSYSKAFKQAVQELESMQKEIQELSKMQADISAFQKQQAAVEATRKRLEMLRQQYDNIQREMEETGNESADMKNKLLAKQLQIDKTSASLEKQTAKLNGMSSALEEAGINTDELAHSSEQLAGEIDALRKKEEAAAEKAYFFHLRIVESSAGQRELSLCCTALMTSDA